MSQLAVQLFVPSRFSRLEWRLHQFTVSAIVGRKTLNRQVTVFCPIPAAASLGTGAQTDETVKEIPLTDLDRLLRSTGMPKEAKKIEVISFLQTMAQSLRAGISVSDAFRRASANAKTPYFRGVLGCLLFYSSTVGGQLSKAMALFPETFDEVVLARVEAGETTGNLQQAFAALAESKKDDYKLRKKLGGLMVYPLVLGAGAVSLFLLMQLFVLPKMNGMFQAMMKSGLPLSTRIVMGSGELMRQHWYLLSIPLLLGYVIYKQRQRIFGHPAWQRGILMIPTVGSVIRHIILIRSLRILSTMLEAGAPIAKTFEIICRVSGNVVYSEYFHAIFLRMKAGEQIDKAFHLERHRIGDMGRDIAQQMMIASSTGSPSEALGPLIEIQNSELQAKLEALPTVLNFGILIMVMPFIVLLALAILEPSLAMAGDMKSMGR